jgi:hypothetical protein
MDRDAYLALLRMQRASLRTLGSDRLIVHKGPKEECL